MMKLANRSICPQGERRNRSKGFTLVELLISMTITLVIVGLLMGMTKMAVKTWQTTNAKTRTSSQAQEVLETVGKDLEGMVVRSGNSYEWLLIKESSNANKQNGPSQNKELVNPLEISFFSAVTDRYYGQINTNNDGGGDISMVRYRLVHQDQIEANGDKPVFILYRERVDPDETFDTMLAQTSIDGLKSSEDIISRENFLAENVFDLTLSFNFSYDKEDGKKGYERVTVQAGGDNRSLSIKGNEILVNGSALSVGGTSDLSLVGVDVSILVLSDSGMNALDKNPITSKAKLSQFLKENGYLYSKSVIVPQP